jgi:hypothetical protein
VRFRLKHDVPVSNRPIRQVAEEFIQVQFARNDREAGRMNGQVTTVRAVDQDSQSLLLRSKGGVEHRLQIDRTADQHKQPIGLVVSLVSLPAAIVVIPSLKSRRFADNQVRRHDQALGIFPGKASQQKIDQAFCAGGDILADGGEAGNGLAGDRQIIEADKLYLIR